ncbi:MAG: fatty acid desaturase [Nitrosomonas sp.]|nr:MAG: fatty acid desaturase [Nitrosomonas sp.]
MSSSSNKLCSFVTYTLRPSLQAGGLSTRAKQEILSLSGDRPIRFIAELILNWIVIAFIISIGVYFSNLFVTVVCILLMGTRQMVLGLLLHEQVHRLGLRNKYGDWIVNLLVAYPIVVTTVEDYAKVHLMHHKYFFTKQDPDFVRKSGDEWTFPMSIGAMVAIVLRDLSGINTIKLIRGKTAPKNADEFQRKNPSPSWLRWVFYSIIAVILTIAEGWTVFLIYWILPLLTSTQLCIRWIAVSEHQYNIENANSRDVTPLIFLKWWQKILMPDLNFSMHIYHHEHPGVSFSNLPKVHAIYQREGLVDESSIFRGQGAYLRYLLGRN